MKAFKKICLVVFVLSNTLYLQAQNSMGVGTDTPSPNAVLELVSPTNNQGFLVPRMTTAQRTDAAFTGNLTASDNGLMVFDSDEGSFYFWMDGNWQPVSNQVAVNDSVLFADTAGFALDAETIGGLTVETAVPAGAVFTDSQLLSDVLTQGNDAGANTIVNLADPIDPQDAATKNYVDAQGGGSSVWNTSGDDIYYDQGNVGISTATPSSQLQIGDDFHFYHFENPGLPIEGEVIGENVYADSTLLVNSKDGPGSFIIFYDGNIEFLSFDSVGAGQDLLSLNQIDNSLVLKKSRDAEFSGAVEIGILRDSTSFSSGTISYSGTGFFGYDGQDWKRLDGLGLPFSQNVFESVTNVFSLTNFGTTSVARFELSNTAAIGNALTINNNSQETNSRGIRVDHSGFGNAGEFLVTGTGGPNTQYAVFARTFGTGSAGRFEIDNSLNNSSALLGRIDAGTGNAVEGYTAGEGPAGRFTNANSANGSVTLLVNNEGTNSVASFQNTATATQSAVEIINNGSGAGLTIQSGAGTTRFGDDALIAGPMTTTGAVYSNSRAITASETVLDTDHIIYITAGSDIVITLPDAGLHEGREIILYATIGGTTYTINSEDLTDNFVDGDAVTTSLLFGSGANVRTYALRAIAGDWVVISSRDWPN